MSSSNRAAEARRVLVLGERREALEATVEELARRGIKARAATADAALDGLNEPFDLIALTTDLNGDRGLALEQAIRARSPNVSFVRSYEPYAAHQIAEATRRSGASVDLAAYCARIGYRGALQPTLATLRALQEHHLATIPFEAIDVLLDRGINLAPAAIDAKLIGAQRGGYCYEHNSLFKRVLQAIGFDVEALVASVRWMAEPGAPPATPTHMTLRVHIDGVPWLADVGFGGNVPPQPFRMDTSEAQDSRHETFRIIPFGAGHLLQAKIRDEWQPLYVTAAEPMLDSHYEVFNWYTSTHAASPFRQELIVAKTTADARFSLLGNRLTIRSADGKMERRHLAFDDFAPTLKDVFALEADPAWHTLFRVP